MQYKIVSVNMKVLGTIQLNPEMGLHIITRDMPQSAGVEHARVGLNFNKKNQHRRNIKTDRPETELKRTGN